MSNSPAVSIGMPVFNGERLISQAIRSLLYQSFGDFELIISDNSSTDRTPDICKFYAHRDSRVKYIRQPLNIGAAANFEYVLNVAQAGMFMWAAHDDKWEKSYLSQALLLFDDETCCFVFPSFSLVSIDLFVATRFKSDMFKFVESVDRKERVLHFLALHHHSHKCNIVYSLFKSHFLRAALKLQDIGNDGALGAVILGMGRGRILNGSLFSKRYHKLWPGALSPVRSLFLRNHSTEFKLAKESSFSILKNLFPEYINEIKSIYECYFPSTSHSNYSICQINHCLQSD